MRAIIASPQGPSLTELSTPAPGRGQVLVRVRAAALNRIDLMMLTGHAHGSMGGAGIPLGLEWAGDVIEVGPGVDVWQVGDRVMSPSGGAFAERAVGPAGQLYRIPDGLSYSEAVGLPVALQTMHDAIATNGHLQPGQSVLIQGASSGVGLMALQIAKFLGAGLVIGSSTSPERRARLTEFGADLAIDTRDESWVDEVLAATQGNGVDLVVDQIAGSLVNLNMRATRILGRIVNVGRLGGMTGEFDFDLHALRRLTYVGVTFRTRSAEEVERINQRVTQDLWPALSEGKLRLPVDSVYPFEAFRGALERMRRNEHLGKIVLEMDAGARLRRNQQRR
ncbi:MAG: zinc-binding dehydrogenase [Novosphingobium sp.]|nr:zinc-binding dehydrogenase [Novosphingobium sp.]